MVNDGVPRVQKYQNTKPPTEKVERRFRGWNDYQTQLTLFKNTEVVK